jgi:hypothetical protein
VIYSVKSEQSQKNINYGKGKTDLSGEKKWTLWT